MASNPPPSGLISCHILRCPNNPKGAQFFFHVLQGQSPHFELSQRDEGGKERNNLRLFHVSSTLFGLLSCCLCLLRFTFGLLRIFRILHLPYRSLNGSMLGRWHWQCHPPATEAKTYLSAVVSTCRTMIRNACERPTSWQSSLQFWLNLNSLEPLDLQDDDSRQPQQMDEENGVPRYH